ncbi:alpha-tocopherol transfer protein-like isoform X2 [Leptidea sinapis]|uniref:CRAL-TRIO domain-containing protein n=2 Tax=Leptidea sinapis TaxID=189913 RepID=A0A5E4QV79_9NEOP|nr:alpha-tocopherol transfer protein-like isoform X2 [Leptidea sinapis]VVD02071.1 unnamed protein product [Leptidea sinapis]
MTEKEIEDKKLYVEELKHWIEGQPHLPNIEDKMLLRFVHSCYYDIERAKGALELFCNLRTLAPELLTNRDPLSQQMQSVLSWINVAQINISKNRCLWLWQLDDPGLVKYDYLLDAKFFFLSTDAYFLDSCHLPDADVVVLDAHDISLKFITKFNLSHARKLSKYQEEAIPVRLTQIHVINAPTVIDKIFGLMKPLLKKELTDLIHFHTPNSTTIFKYFDKEDLPEDFGGTRPSMKELAKNTESLLMKWRDELKSDDLWKALPIEKKKSNNTPAVSSFRSLAID